jgi:hypothetical protein
VHQAFSVSVGQITAARHDGVEPAPQPVGLRPSMLLNKRRTPFGWGWTITKKLLNVERDGASYEYARTFCRLGPPDADGSAVWSACAITSNGSSPSKTSRSRRKTADRTSSRSKNRAGVGKKRLQLVFPPASAPHEAIFQVSRTAMHKSGPNGASHLTRSTEDEVRRAPARRRQNDLRQDVSPDGHQRRLGNLRDFWHISETIDHPELYPLRQSADITCCTLLPPSASLSS